MSIWKLLGIQGDDAGQAPPSADTETVRKIVGALDNMDRDRARYVAAFAYVLSRVAHVDMDISSEETRAMERIVHELGDLPEEQAVLVVQMAKTQALLFAGTENFLVTREFHRMSTPEQRRKLLECLFAVSAADESISSAESQEIRKIADELKIEHKDFIQARLRFKEYLSVLKKDRPGG